MNKMPSECPICKAAHTLTVTKFTCDTCGTTIAGEFTQADAHPFAVLSTEQLEFVKVFIKCEGKINRMEPELGVSYPTIRNRLQEVIKTLGFEPTKEESSGGKPVSEITRRQILDDLDSGKLTADAAMRLLRGD